MPFFSFHCQAAMGYHGYRWGNAAWVDDRRSVLVIMQGHKGWRPLLPSSLYPSIAHLLLALLLTYCIAGYTMWFTQGSMHCWNVSSTYLYYRLTHISGIIIGIFSITHRKLLQLMISIYHFIYCLWLIFRIQNLTILPFLNLNLAGHDHIWLSN